MNVAVTSHPPGILHSPKSTVVAFAAGLTTVVRGVLMAVHATAGDPVVPEITKVGTTPLLKVMFGSEGSTSVMRV